MSAVLEIRNARRTFAERKALQDVSIDVASGEILALLGPNGAGKTTLIRAAAGRLRLEAGTVRVCGRDPASDNTARRELGLVPQSIALYPNLTASENLDIFGRLMGLRGKALRAAIDTGLTRAGLTDRRSELLSTLSGGMQRRLNIVVGALHQPKLFILDEPTVGVDLASRENIHALLHDLCDTGIGVLLCTHDFDQAASMADRVAFMAEGRVLIEGGVKELIHGVFGDAKELVVTLDAPAKQSAELTLRDFDLLPARDKRLWSGPLKGGFADLPEIERQLEKSGLHAAELRLRDPSLGGVFLQITGGLST